MKTLRYLLLLAALVMMVMAIGACDTNEVEEEVEEPEEVAEEISMLDLLRKGQDVEGMSFDFTITEHDMDQEFSGKMWIQEQKHKIEIDNAEDFDLGEMEEYAAQTIVYITDQEEREHIIYLPEENLAYKQQLPEAEEIDNPQEQAEEISEDEARGAEYLGTETIDGTECHGWRIENEDTATEMWLHNEYGLPLKTEVFQNDELVFTSEIKNLTVEDLPEDTFELPEDAEMLDMEGIIEDMM